MDFLNSTNISYVTKKITNASELNENLIVELKKSFEEEAIDAPFCNDGDYDLDDLRDDLPADWKLKEEELIKPYEALITLAIIDYSAEREIDFDEFDDVALNAHSLGGIYPLSVESVEEDPFSSDFTTSNTDMTLLFRVCDEDGDFESDECPIEDFEKYKEGWKELLHDLEK